MKRLIWYSLFLSLALPAFAQDDWKRDSIPPEIYTSADYIPEYPGGWEALDAFFKRNFVYPAKAWREEERHGNGVLRFIVRADGVACGLQQDGMHPALYAELNRVFHLMPRWKPATKDGKPVDVGYNLSSATLALYDQLGTELPFHIVSAMKGLKRYTDENKRYDSGLDAEDLGEVTAKAAYIAGMAPENVELVSPLTRLLAAQGDMNRAMAMADTCARIYHAKDYDITADTMSITKDDIDKETDKRTQLYKALSYYFTREEKEGRIIKGGYDGKDDMHAALTYAWICDAAVGGQRADSAYRHVLEVIDGRIEHQDVRIPARYRENGEYKNLMKEKLALVMKPGTGGVDLREEDRHEIMESYNYNDAMRVIDRKIKEGKINNARILQITKQLSEIRRSMNDHRMGKDSLNLYGLRALTLYLHQGMDAQRRYMDSVSGQSKELKEYFGKMSKNMQKHEAELSDRAAVLHCLACFAPINEEGDSKEEKKRRAKEFYRYRDAVKEVYPLEWLWK